MAKTHQAELWLSMAAQARVVAGRLYDNELRLQMLVVAAGYEALARRVEALAKVGAPANNNAAPRPAATAINLRSR
jgi:hypothetical protein